MDTEVLKQSDDALDALLIGKHPRIGTILRSKSNPISPPPEQNQTNDVKPKQIFGAIRKESKLPTDSIQESHSSTKIFSKIQMDEGTVSKLDQYLESTEACKRRKMLFMHQEVEEKYIRPLEMRIGQKLFSRTANPQRNAPHGGVSKNSSGLIDPIFRYRQNEHIEHNISRIMVKEGSTVLSGQSHLPKIQQKSSPSNHLSFQ